MGKIYIFFRFKAQIVVRNVIKARTIRYNSLALFFHQPYNTLLTACGHFSYQQQSYHHHLAIYTI